MRALAAADVQMDELVKQRLEHVAGSRLRIGGYGEPYCDGTAKPRRTGWVRLRRTFSSGALAASGPTGEHGQRAQTLELPAQVDAGDEVVGGVATGHGGDRRYGPGGENMARCPPPAQR